MNCSLPVHIGPGAEMTTFEHVATELSTVPGTGHVLHEYEGRRKVKAAVKSMDGIS